MRTEWYNGRMYYFASRQAAGDLIADQLESKYTGMDCAIVALGDGAVMVGSSIAKRLHGVLNMLLTSPIQLPREQDVLAVIDNFGGMTYNDMYAPSELEELKTEFFNYIEQQKLEKLFEMNRLLGKGGVIAPQLLNGKVVIVVSDGLANGFSMMAASQFLKPVRVRRLIMVSPFAKVNAIDLMHVMADEMICLNVLDDIISINHYYDDNTMPPHEKIVQIVENIVEKWQ